MCQTKVSFRVLWTSRPRWSASRPWERSSAPPQFTSHDDSMSSLLLLPAPEEERATLEAALAFLDGFESDACTTDGSLSPDVDGPSQSYGGRSDDTLRTHREHAQCASPPAKPARRYKKTEILQLRKQAEQLAAQLSELQARCARERRALEPREMADMVSSASNDVPAPALLGYLRVGAKGTTSDLRAVMLEYRRLQEAKALNLQLKVEWRKQLELMVLLEATFEQQFTGLVRVRSSSCECVV